MAFTIDQSPQSYTPAYNQIISVVNSSNYNLSNFKYLCDIYITGKTFAGSPYLRLKAPPTPSGIGINKGVFDVRKILESYVSYNIGDTIYGFQQSSGCIIEYQMKFGEEYGPSSGVLTYPNQATDSVRYCWNGLFDFLKWTTYNAGTFVSNSYPNRKMLTDRVDKGKIRVNEKAWVYALTQTSGDIYYAIVETTQNNWANYQTYLIRNQYQAVTNFKDRMIRFPAGWNMNSIPAGDFDFATIPPPILNSNIQEYRISFKKFDGPYLYALQSFKVDTDCTNHSIYRLHFLNKLGGFDSFSFIRASHVSSNIKRSQFKKPIGKFISASNYGYEAADAEDINFYTEIKDAVQLNSDWVDEDTMQWLEELVTSPVIFLDDVTYGLVKINITDTKFQQKKHLTEKVFNLQISIEYSYDRYRQRA